MSTRADDFFSSRLPIIQAPMAGISTPALAAAVSNAGGLGSIGIGAASLDVASSMIAETRSLTDEPFNVNVFCHEPAARDPHREREWIEWMAPLFAEVGGQVPTELREIYITFVESPDVFDMLLAARPAVISFHFGLPPAEWIDAFRDAGVLLLATATNPEDARAIERAGIDAIVAQGYEAGGHRGAFELDRPDNRLSAEELVIQLRDATRLPVIAAGGIMNGADIRTMLDRGALAAQLGTAFLLCPESATSARHRMLLTGPDAGQIVMTDVISGRLARGLHNPMVLRGIKPGMTGPPSYPVAYDLARQLHAAASAKGNADFGAYWAGTGARHARELPAAELVALLMTEANAG
jgi:nitronate monooxygenase